MGVGELSRQVAPKEVQTRNIDVWVQRFPDMNMIGGGHSLTHAESRGFLPGVIWRQSLWSNHSGSRPPGSCGTPLIYKLGFNQNYFQISEVSTWK